MTRWIAGLLVLLTVLPARALDARAQGVELQLVLAVDASGSVNTERFELQKRGYAAAFRDSRVREAIGDRTIMVTMFQWTGPDQQAEVVGWSRLSDAASLERFAAGIEATPRKLFGGGTSISGAIDHALRRFDAAGTDAARRIIDISGDGANNRGRPSEEARDEAVQAGVTINGLPIPWIEPGLVENYRSAVIGGPGSFLVVADTYPQFAAAILQKLVTEIAGRGERRAGR